MDLFQPMLMARIVNVGIANLNLNEIFRAGGMMLAAACIGLAGGVGCAVFASIAAMNMGADLRESLFRKIQTFSFGNLDRLETGHLITRLTNDVVQVEQMVMMSLRILVRAPLLIVGSLIMTVIISLKLSSILLVVIPILILSISMISRRAYPLFSIVQKKLDRLNTVIQENLSGIRLVKAFSREQFEHQKFSHANENLMDASLNANRLVTIIMPTMMLSLNFAIVAIIWLGGIEVQAGHLAIGNIIAYINYLLHILFHLMIMSTLVIRFSRAQASADRIVEVFDAVSEIQDAPDRTAFKGIKGAIKFERVTFSYDRKRHDPVLTAINFQVHPGQTVAILGATGSGKSSLIHLLPRFYDVTKGRVLIDGIDVSHVAQEDLRKQIAVVQQQMILFSGTIRENIRYGEPDAVDERVIQAAQAAQAHEFIMEFSDGYDTHLGQRGVNLSGGQKQRISLARALLIRPKILILDDSTSAVDFVTEAKIRNALKELLQETTCVIVAQRISSVRHADKILVLDDGRVAAEGTHEDLLKTSNIYQDIYHSQVKVIEH